MAFRLRFVLVTLLLLLTAVAAFAVFHAAPVPVGVVVLGTASLVIAGVIGFAHLRHTGLAVLVALAPVPGMLVAALFRAPAAGDLVAIYAIGEVAAALVAAMFLARLLGGEDRIVAGQGALARSALILAMALAARIALLAVFARPRAIADAATLAGALLSVLLFVPFGAAALPYGEIFFVRANRVRELRERSLRPLVFVAEPRWGLSAGGIVLVFATLGAFGVPPSLFQGNAHLLLWAAAALVPLVAVLALARDWRDALAAGLASAVLALTLAWLARRTGSTAALAIALALLPALAVAVRSRSHRAAGDEARAARQRALEEIAPGGWYGVLGAAAAAIPWITRAGPLPAAAILLAGCVGLLAVPAIATALDTVLRRRRSVEALYGRR